MKERYDVMGVTETWCTGKKKIKLPTNEYQVLSNPSKQIAGGGMAIFIKRKIICQEFKCVGQNIMKVKLLTRKDIHTILILVYAQPQKKMEIFM